MTRLERARETVAIMQDQWSAYVREHGSMDDEYMIRSLRTMYTRQWYRNEYPRVMCPTTPAGLQLLDDVFTGEVV